MPKKYAKKITKGTRYGETVVVEFSHRKRCVSYWLVNCDRCKQVRLQSEESTRKFDACYVCASKEKRRLPLPLHIVKNVAVDPDTYCWVWQGAKTSNGYGEIGFVENGNKRVRYAHRVSYEVFRETRVPKGLTLDHLCNRRDCVNPSHLEPVTHQENCRRAAERRKAAKEAAEADTTEIAEIVA